MIFRNMDRARVLFHKLLRISERMPCCPKIEATQGLKMALQELRLGRTWR